MSMTKAELEGRITELEEERDLLRQQNATLGGELQKSMNRELNVRWRLDEANERLSRAESLMQEMAAKLDTQD